MSIFKKNYTPKNPILEVAYKHDYIQQSTVVELDNFLEEFPYEDPMDLLERLNYIDKEQKQDLYDICVEEIPTEVVKLNYKKARKTVEKLSHTGSIALEQIMCKKQA